MIEGLTNPARRTLFKPSPNNWPWWVAIAVAVGGLSLTSVIAGILGVAYLAVGGSLNDSAFVALATVFQDVAFVAVALGVALTVGRVTLGKLGISGGDRPRTLAVAGMLYLLYLVSLLLYGTIVEPSTDSTPDRLGANSGFLGVLVFCLIAGLLAPVVEEIVFRGVIFRSLANRTGVLVAALASGLFFGALHWDFATLDRLLQILPLVLFGVTLALAYAITGTLLAAIALHAINNALAIGMYALGISSSDIAIVGAVVWSALMIAVFHLLYALPAPESGRVATEAVGV